MYFSILLEDNKLLEEYKDKKYPIGIIRIYKA